MQDSKLRSKLKNALYKLAEAREELEEIEDEDRKFSVENEIESLREDRVPSVANSLVEYLQILEE